LLKTKSPVYEEASQKSAKPLHKIETRKTLTGEFPNFFREKDQKKQDPERDTKKRGTEKYQGYGSLSHRKLVHSMPNYRV